MLTYLVVWGINVSTTLLWKRLGKNNVVTLIWMFVPVFAIILIQPISKTFNRETLYGGLLFFHLSGFLKYPINMIAVAAITRLRTSQVHSEFGGGEQLIEKDIKAETQRRVRESVEAWLDNVMALSMFSHLRLYMAIVIMIVQFLFQIVLALLETLLGLHSAILLNSNILTC